MAWKVRAWRVRVHVTALEEVGRPDPVGGQRGAAEVHAGVTDPGDRLQVAPDRALADQEFIPSRRRSSASWAVMGSWHEPTPAAA
jgi:hypothetical protein